MTNYYSKEPKSKYEFLICVFREFREIGFTENIFRPHFSSFCKHTHTQLLLHVMWPCSNVQPLTMSKFPVKKPSETSHHVS